jgi:hypothetical protein
MLMLVLLMLVLLMLALLEREQFVRLQEVQHPSFWYHHHYNMEHKLCSILLHFFLLQDLFQ